MRHDSPDHPLTRNRVNLVLVGLLVSDGKIVNSPGFESLLDHLPRAIEPCTNGLSIHLGVGPRFDFASKIGATRPVDPLKPIDSAIGNMPSQFAYALHI